MRAPSDAYHKYLRADREKGKCAFPCDKHLADGKIIAVKGLGGYHLACDASNEKAVLELRGRKMRPFKPLAIMVKDIKTIKDICLAGPEEEKLLLSTVRPIVLLRKKLPLGTLIQLTLN